MRRYGGGMLYAALPLHMQKGCFRIRTHDQQLHMFNSYLKFSICAIISFTAPIFPLALSLSLLQSHIIM